MLTKLSHAWDLAPKEAFELQNDLAVQVERQVRMGPVRHVAGIDVSVRDDVSRAAVVVLDLEGLAPVDYAVATRPATFRYVPGLLAFREGPPVLGALEKLTVWPDLFAFDAHGLAPPRRIGLASHIGAILDQPTIGCAKSRLIGTHGEPGNGVGDWTPLRDQDETVGAVVRSRPGVKPVYVSLGHRVDLPTSVDIVLRCGKGYRLPETTRLAQLLAGGAELPIGRS